MSTILILEDLPPAQQWLREAAWLAFPMADVVIHDRVSKALSWLSTHEPDLALIDLCLPDGSGIDCITACKQLASVPPVLVVTMFDDDQHLLPALKAGADGYLLKEEPKPLIAQALQQLAENRPALSDAITQRLMQLAQETVPASAPPPCPLTIREQDILRTLAKGYQTQEIARLLNISPHTAAKHTKNIYAKLGIHSRAEAVCEALRFGLIEADIPHTGDSP